MPIGFDPFAKPTARLAPGRLSERTVTKSRARSNVPQLRPNLFLKRRAFRAHRNRIYACQITAKIRFHPSFDA